VSLRWRIVIAFAIALGLLQIALGGAYYAEVYRVLPDQTLDLLRARVTPIVEAQASRIAAGGAPLSRVARDLAAALTVGDTSAVVLNATGEIVATGRRGSDGPATVPAHPGLIQQVMGGDSRVLVVRSAEGRRVVLYLPLRASPSSPAVGVVQLTSPLPEVERSLARIRWLLTGTAAVTLLTGSGLALVFGRRLARPLEQLETTCRAIARGAFGRRSELRHGDDEVGRLATAFDEMVRRLEVVLLAHRRFVADAAHQMKTPVTALSGNLELVERGIIADSEHLRESYRAMRRQLTRLDQMVRKLLTLSMLDAGAALERRTVDVAEIARSVLEDFRSAAEGRRMEVRSTGDPHAHVDPERIREALSNLVDNAVRHTAPGGSVLIEVGRGRVCVRDDGAGIASDRLERVFDRFYRHPPSGDGSGLGLAIVKGIIEAHGGTVSVQSTAGRGAAFVMTLPGG
jgi:signal transduction histidine kinase